MMANKPTNTMNTPTPRTRSEIIKDNIHIAMRADDSDQCIAHLEEAYLDIENMEDQLTAVTKQRDMWKTIRREEYDRAIERIERLKLSAFTATTLAENYKEQRDRLAEALTDMLSGWRYIRKTHGDLYGVGWDRAQTKARQALQSLNQAAVKGGNHES